MKSAKRTLFAILAGVLAGALAIGTLFLASSFFADFLSWSRSLPNWLIRFAPTSFAFIASLFVGCGVYLRRRTDPSDYAL